MKLTSMGDVLFALSIVGDLKTANPAVEIDWAVDDDFADLVTCCSGIDRVWSFPLRKLQRKFHMKQLYSIVSNLIKLRTRYYEVVLDLQGMIKSNVVALSARSPRRWTCHRSQMAEPLLGYFFDSRYAILRSRHAVDNYRFAGSTAFGYIVKGRPDFMMALPKFSLVSDALSETQNFLRGRPYLISFPFASKIQKVVPVQQWLALAGRLAAAEESPVFIFLAGTPDERSRARAYGDGVDNFFLAPRMTIREVLSLINGARAFIGADTGLTYISAALGTPTLALFVGTNPGVLSPSHWALNALAVHVSNADWVDEAMEYLSRNLNLDVEGGGSRTKTL